MKHGCLPYPPCKAKVMPRSPDEGPTLPPMPPSYCPSQGHRPDAGEPPSPSHLFIMMPPDSRAQHVALVAWLPYNPIYSSHFAAKKKQVAEAVKLKGITCSVECKINAKIVSQGALRRRRRTDSVEGCFGTAASTMSGSRVENGMVHPLRKSTLPWAFAQVRLGLCLSRHLGKITPSCVDEPVADLPPTLAEVAREGGGSPPGSWSGPCAA